MRRGRMKLIFMVAVARFLVVFIGDVHSLGLALGVALFHARAAARSAALFRGLHVRQLGAQLRDLIGLLLLPLASLLHGRHPLRCCRSGCCGSTSCSCCDRSLALLLPRAAGAHLVLHLPEGRVCDF
jgi:hypothetical protein